MNKTPNTEEDEKNLRTPDEGEPSEEAVPPSVLERRHLEERLKRLIDSALQEGIEIPHLSEWVGSEQDILHVESLITLLEQGVEHKHEVHVREIFSEFEQEQVLLEEEYEHLMEERKYVLGSHAVHEVLDETQVGLRADPSLDLEIPHEAPEKKGLSHP